MSDINKDYLELAQLAYDMVLQTMIEGEKKYGVDIWKGVPQTRHIDHAIVHLGDYSAGDKADDHITHALTRCAMIRWLEGKA